MTPARFPVLAAGVLALLATPALAARSPPPAPAAPTPVGAATASRTPAGAPTPAPVSTPPPSAATARLEGSFLLAGRVSTADDVRGEHRGETVLRTWAFSSSCAAGPCGTVALVRGRGRGREPDKLTLRRVSPGYYRGAGRFYAPLRCAKRVYRRGQSVPFTITVRVSAADVVNGVTLATRVQGSYVNRTRSNLTPCFAVLGHDAATYHGHLLETPAKPPGAAAGRDQT